MSERYPESKAVKVWRKGQLTFSIVRQPPGYYCGYVRFPKRPLIEQGYDGIVTYVPVHGGVTYAEEDEDGSMVYGFDCAHAGDDENSTLWDLDWLTKECERMATGIKVARKYEKKYLLAKTNEEKAEIIDAYHEELKNKYGIEFKLSDNFGAMLRLLGGKL